MREFYLPANQFFTCSGVPPGHYELRVKNIDQGGYLKSDKFLISEHRTVQGIQYTEMSVTLYTVPNGNFSSSPLDPQDF